MTNMFDEIFNLEAILFMINVSGLTEDSDSVRAFRRDLIEKIDGITIMKLAREWKNLSEEGQVEVAKNHMGSYHISRFIMYMDYLWIKIQEGNFSGL